MKMDAASCSFQMIWADYRSLLDPNFFFISGNLANLEQISDNRYRDSIHWSRRFEYPWAYLSLFPYKKDETLLDIGSNGAPLQFLLANNVGNVYSVDPRPGHADWVIGAMKKLSISNILPIEKGIVEARLASNFFNKVFCISVLEHIAKDKVETILEDLIRVTKQGGKLAITLDVIIARANPNPPKCDNYLDMSDLIYLSKKYSFAIPNIPSSAMMMWNDNLQLAIGGIIINGK